jgi:hypothetical protein
MTDKLDGEDAFFGEANLYHNVLLYPGSHIQSNNLATNGGTMCSRSHYM